MKAHFPPGYYVPNLRRGGTDYSHAIFPLYYSCLAYACNPFLPRQVGLRQDQRHTQRLGGGRELELTFHEPGLVAREN